MTNPTFVYLVADSADSANMPVVWTAPRPLPGRRIGNRGNTGFGLYLVDADSVDAALRLDARPIIPVSRNGLDVMIAANTEYTLAEYEAVFSDPAEAWAGWLGSVADKLVLIDGVAEQVNP